MRSRMVMTTTSTPGGVCRFTSKLEGMFTYMETSRDAMQGFNALLAGSSEG